MSYGYGTHYTPSRIMGRPTIPDDPNACGTNRGIWQHRRKGEKNCQKCREKQNANRRASYRARMERKRHTEIPGNTQDFNRDRRAVVTEISWARNRIDTAWTNKNGPGSAANTVIRDLTTIRSG